MCCCTRCSTAPAPRRIAVEHGARRTPTCTLVVAVDPDRHFRPQIIGCRDTVEHDEAFPPQTCTLGRADGRWASCTRSARNSTGLRISGAAEDAGTASQPRSRSVSSQGSPPGRIRRPASACRSRSRSSAGSSPRPTPSRSKRRCNASRCRDRTLAALDGKRVRGGNGEGRGETATLVDHATGAALANRAFNESGGQTSVVCALLDEVLAEGRVTAVDALHATRNTAHIVKETRGADYRVTIGESAPETCKPSYPINRERDGTGRFKEMSPVPVAASRNAASLP